jgi:hypothetical protein
VLAMTMGYHFIGGRVAIQHTAEPQPLISATNGRGATDGVRVRF